MGAGVGLAAGLAGTPPAEGLAGIALAGGLASGAGRGVEVEGAGTGGLKSASDGGGLLVGRPGELAAGWMAAQGRGGSGDPMLSMLGAQSSVCFPPAHSRGQERREGEAQDLDGLEDLLDDPGLLDELLCGDLM